MEIDILHFRIAKICLYYSNRIEIDSKDEIEIYVFKQRNDIYIMLPDIKNPSVSFLFTHFLHKLIMYICTIC